MSQPYYTIQIEKSTYSYGIDTTIKGKVIFDDLADEGDVKVELFIISGITKETILTFEDLKDRSIIEDSDYNEESISSLECSKENPNFSFDIKNSNLYGETGISKDSYSTFYIHAICAGGFDLDDGALVNINWPELENVKLKEKEQKEIPDTISMIENKFDPINNIYTFGYNEFISLDTFNTIISNSTTARIGKNLNESKVFWIIYRISLFLLPIFLFGLPILLFLSPEFLSGFQLEIDIQIGNMLLSDFIIGSIYFGGIYGSGLIVVIILRFYFIAYFKKKIGVSSQKLEIISSVKEEDSDENTYEYNEEYLLKYFRNDTIQLKNILYSKNPNSEYPVIINGKITIGVSLESSYHIYKGADHYQEIINKIFYEGDFSSMNSLLEKQIPIPKWVQDMANMEEPTLDIEGEIIIDIRYFNGLLVNRHSISLF